MMDSHTTTPQDRAKRLKRLRKLLGLSRRTLGELAEISHRNIENWEYARSGGLSNKGADRIAQALKKLNCQCTPEWLLEGTSPAPILSNTLTAMPVTTSDTQNSPELIQAEIQRLKKQYPNLIVQQISDQSMAPVFGEKDYVAGVFVPMKQTDPFLEKPCIIHLPDNTTIIRCVRAGCKEGSYTLYTLNQDHSVAQPYLYDIKPIGIAPIIWFRREL